MNWQDELERLDAELAEGNIDAHEHRRRADDLLAGASGPGPGPQSWRSQSPARNAERDTQKLPPPWERGQARAQQPPEPPAEPEQPAQPEQPESWQPPKQQWIPPEQPQERTGPIEPVREAPNQQPKEPSFPPVPQTARPNQPQPNQPQPNQPQPSQRMGPVEQLPWHPGVAQPGAPEPPAEKPARGGNRGMWLVGGVGLVVLILVVLLVWLLAFRDTGQSSDAAAAPASQETSPSQQASGPPVIPEGLPGKLPKPPGEPLRAKEQQPIDSIVDAGYYTKQIADSIAKGGSKTMLLRQSVRSGSEIYLLGVIPNKDQRSCQSSAAAINEFQHQLGFQNAEQNAFGANTSTLTLNNPQGVYYRTAYCSSRMTVLVAAASAKKEQAESLRDGVTGFGKQVADALPPN